MEDRSIVERILRYVEENLEKELSLEMIAKELNYSKFYLARTFKKHTGVTLYHYIRGLRLDKAARKLIEGKEPIVEIAFEAGYHSQQAFTQAFHYVYHSTPKEYRRVGVYLPKQDKISMRIRKYDMMCLYAWAKGRAA